LAKSVISAAPIAFQATTSARGPIKRRGVRQSIRLTGNSTSPARG
jgi:hypothetical protein